MAIFLIIPLCAQADLPGELLVKGPEGTRILIDGELAGVITNGTLSVTLLEGEYELQARIGGKLIFTQKIEVTGAETTVIHIAP
jgi:hypothetical protein